MCVCARAHALQGPQMSCLPCLPLFDLFHLFDLFVHVMGRTLRCVSTTHTPNPLPPPLCPVLCICGCACDIVRPGWCGGNQPRGSSPKASVAEVWSPGTQLVASTTRLAGMHTQQSMVGKIGAYPSSLPLRPTGGDAHATIHGWQDRGIPLQPSPPPHRQS